MPIDFLNIVYWAILQKIAKYLIRIQTFKRENVLKLREMPRSLECFL